MTFNAAVIMPPLQQIIFDKTLGIPLAGGIVRFFEDANRTIPKVVYELTGTGPGSYTYVSLGSVLTLSGIGTYIDAEGGNIPIYLWPFTGSPNDAIASTIAQNYYITVYSSTNVFQFDIPNWPGVVTNFSPANGFGISDNIISNGQFVDVTFSPVATSANPIVFTTTGTNTATPIAPDWSIVTTGNGTFSVWQQTILDDTAPGNPAYALGLTSSGYTIPLILRQRIFAPRILSGTYVSGTFIAETTGGSYTFTMNYTPSITGTIQQLATGTTFSSQFTLINGPPVLIVDPGSGSGYVDITIVIPQNITVQLSCIQVAGTTMGIPVGYLQETPEREIDHLFHYFQPQLNFKPIKSWLVGWDFPLNPAQPGGSTVATTSNASSYTWDQTILFQSTVSKLSTSRAADGSMVITSADATGATQAAIIQYLPPTVIDTMLQSDLSVNVFGLASSTLKCTVSLWYTTNVTLPNVKPGTGLSLVTSLDANGHPSVVAAGWTEIVFATNGAKAQFAFNSTTTSYTDYPLSYFPSQNGTMVPATATFFAIVVGTSAIPNAGTITFNSISLVSGKIPTRPAPQTQSDVLNDCQFYFRTSFLPGQAPAFGLGVNSGPSFVTNNQAANTVTQGPIITFDLSMITAPAISQYNPGPSQTGGSIWDFSIGANWGTSSTPSQISANGFVTKGTTPTAGGTADNDLSGVHWTADARLGTF
jgi:hypothetical protein